MLDDLLRALAEIEKGARILRRADDLATELSDLEPSPIDDVPPADDSATD